MKTEIILNIENSLMIFRETISNQLNADEREDYENLAAITDKILNNYKNNNLSELKKCLGGFFRKVSDSYSKWPIQFMALNAAIESLSKEILK